MKTAKKMMVSHSVTKRREERSEGFKDICLPSHNCIYNTLKGIKAYQQPVFLEDRDPTILINNL